jgi:propionyl-CoA synthetase
MVLSYKEEYNKWQSSPCDYWEEASHSISWDKKFTRVLNDERKPFYRWFSGGKINVCFNAVDRHVIAGRGDHTALIYDSPSAKIKGKYTYSQLLHKVSKLAGGLRSL